MADTPRLPKLPEPPEPDRRTALKGMAATSVAAAAVLLPILPAQAQHAHTEHNGNSSVQEKSGYTPKLITGEKRDWLTAVCDRIIPRTDTPGAADVGVADQIDWLATRKDGMADAIFAALARVNTAAGRPITQLTPSQQDEVLTQMSSSLDTEDGRAFSLLKNLTIDAYYSSKPGLNVELGWNANTYLKDFEGCTHDHTQGAAE